MFRGDSQCIPAVSILYFDLFNPFHYSLTALPLIPRFSTAFSTHPYILYLHILCNAILLMLYHSFTFPEFHRILPLSQICSTSEFVYAHAYFCV
jgi:hypothetical protein